MRTKLPTAGPTMRRNATLRLEDFDPEVIEAAREVAQRAGVPLETWIEQAVATDELPQERVYDHAGPSAEPKSRSAPAPVAERPPFAPPPAPAAADEAGSSIAEMMRRLDALDRSVSGSRQTEHEPSTGTSEYGGWQDPPPSAVKIPEPPARENPPAHPVEAPARPDPMIERLAEIERRIGELNTHLTTPRPLGRRGRPLVAEMREAVEAVRRRQRELDGVTEAERPSPAISELQQETSRLRESLGSLATGRDVGALEQAMRALAADVQRANEPADLAAPAEMIRSQVESLVEEVADNIHARVAGEVERLASRVDGRLNAATTSFAERDALNGVHQELDEIRRLIGALAGPERIQSLAQGMQSLSAQIAELRAEGGDNARPAVAELKPLLEEIRSGLKTSGDSKAIESKAILGRIDALADQMERTSVNPVRDMIGRLENLGETLRRPQAAGEDLTTIQTMLRGLAEKVDRVGSGGGNLDSLEKNVIALARRIETRGTDPALAGLERAMGELVQQVATLRDGSSMEAAIERATHKAIAEAIGSERGRPDAGRFEALQADISSMRSQQSAFDQRMHATMDNLSTVLARLVDRLDTPQAEPAPRPARIQSEPVPAAEAPEPASKLDAPLSPAMRTRQVRRPDLPHPRSAPADTIILGDELLEPGAARPAATRAASSEPEASGIQNGNDIKTSFIAAARRAAQAAQADMAGDAPVMADRRGEASRGRKPAVAPDASEDSPSLLGRVRGGIEKRRRPLLLGLAAIVLVLGAFNAFRMTIGGSETESEAVAALEAKAPVAERQPTETQAKLPAPKAAIADPQTTQAIAEAGPAAPKLEAKSDAKLDARPDAPAKAESVAKLEEPTARSVSPSQPGIPSVAQMASLTAELAGVPESLATLKQSALDGDGGAVYELATREADGRGMPRDLAVAAKLYEKLAVAGYAPAQFKLGSFYEKGSGVIRDLAQAKLWYGRAAERGNVRAMHNLAVVYAENPAANGKPDYANAAAWFRRGAEYGVRDSQYNLAVLYARGLGLTQDLAQSYVWFSAAAAQGDEEAGKKRDDIAAKLGQKDLAAAKALASGFRAKVGDPAANEAPAIKSAPPSMSLIGAPPPGAPPASRLVPAAPRSGATGA